MGKQVIVKWNIFLLVKEYSSHSVGPSYNGNMILIVCEHFCVTYLQILWVCERTNQS